MDPRGDDRNGAQGRQQRRRVPRRILADDHGQPGIAFEAVGRQNRPFGIDDLKLAMQLPQGQGPPFFKRHEDGVRQAAFDDRGPDPGQRLYPKPRGVRVEPQDRIAPLGIQGGQDDLPIGGAPAAHQHLFNRKAGRDRQVDDGAVGTIGGVRNPSGHPCKRSDA